MAFWYRDLFCKSVGRNFAIFTLYSRNLRLSTFSWEEISKFWYFLPRFLVSRIMHYLSSWQFFMFIRGVIDKWCFLALIILGGSVDLFSDLLLQLRRPVFYGHQISETEADFLWYFDENETFLDKNSCMFISILLCISPMLQSSLQYLLDFAKACLAI